MKLDPSVHMHRVKIPPLCPTKIVVSADVDVAVSSIFMNKITSLPAGVA